MRGEKVILERAKQREHEYLAEYLRKKDEERRREEEKKDDERTKEQESKRQQSKDIIRYTLQEQ